MAIDKITPHRLDKTSDFKVVPKTSMVDALNILISEDAAFGGSVNNSDEGGDLGVLKNVKGNVSLPPATLADAMFEGNTKIIGSVTDTKLKILYFFVWHEVASEHGVWAYDPMGKLPAAGNYTHRVRKIHKSNLYNFPQHGFVKADIIYTSQSRLNDSDIKAGAEKDFEKDAILYFTDNTNEPRKLNVYMALTGEDADYTEESDRIDYITACPKVPLTPITFEFNADPNKLISGFKSGPGFQFAYQFVYKDGMESAISPYSDIAFAPSIINQGANTNPNHEAYNRCQLTIPENGENIGSIKILARQFNNPEMVIIDEVSASGDEENWDYISRIYSFYNDRIPKGISQNEVNKQYDNLPRTAQAQAVVDNRLMYGNYLEGFDNIEIDCEADVDFIKRPPDFVDFELKLIPAISEQTEALSMEYPGNNPAGTINKSAGYVLSGSGIPAHIEDGTRFNITVKIAPENNFHIYQATNSYHQSRHRGVFKQYEEYQIDYDEPETFDGGNYGYGHQNFDESGAQWIADNIGDPANPSEAMNLTTVNKQVWGVPYSGNNYGVSGAGNQTGQQGPGSAQGGAAIAYPSPKWQTVFGPESGSQREVCYGTSAGNPLILKGGNIVFSCSFTTGGSAGAGQAMITSIVSQLLTGIEPTWGGGTSGENPFLTIHNVERTFEHNIDLSNDQGLDLWDKIYEGTLYSKLISGVVEKKTPISYEPFSPPIGHFIVRKANVTFSLEKDEAFGPGTSYKMLRLSIDKISDVETVTVIRKKFPNAPWSVVTKEFFESGSINDLYENTAINYGGGDINTGGANHNNLSSGYYSTYDPMTIRVIEGENSANPSKDWDYDYEIGPPEAIEGSFEPSSVVVDDIDGDMSPDPVAVCGTLQEYTTNTAVIVGPDQPAFEPIPSSHLNPTLGNNISILQLNLFFGYLDFQQDGVIDNFFRFNREQYQASNPNNTELFPFSLLDGEGGPGAKLTHNYIEGPGEGSPSLSSAPRSIEYSAFDVSVYPGDYEVNYDIEGGLIITSKQRQSIQPRIWVWGAEFTGSITCKHVPSIYGAIYVSGLYGNNVAASNNLIRNGFTSSGFINYYYQARSILPLLQGDGDFGLSTISSFLNIGSDSYGNDVPYTSNINDNVDSVDYDDLGTPGNLTLSIDIRRKHPHIEITNVLQSVGSETESDRTFKSSANHDFGIVYYDERGRHGFVNHLKTVYVPGYSQQERGVANFGRSEITLTIQPEAPEWAHSYKIAYTKNTTVENFTQYSIGGAFIKGEETSNLISDTNIYVSLNYLQESPISYVSDWGARDPEGGLNMFKYLPGRNQKLRVISSYNSINQRHYHQNYEFAISDFVILGDGSGDTGASPDAENPLTTWTGDKPFKRGAFLVLKNNDSADGFSHTDVKAALNAGDTSLWDQNCIVEIYTPARDQERFYYEIGDTYSINQPGTAAATHSQTSITLRKGDVWWRKVPVNFRGYQSEGVYVPGYYMTTNFPDLIQYTEDLQEANPSASNFKSYYLETETASDLFKADATLIGRPNIISEDAVETKREASITYSEKSNPNSRVVNYSSFNLTLLNFKDLQEEFGDINYMCNMEGDVFVIQSDRCTLVPASKTLFSDVSGVETVAASQSPLGQEKIYAGRAGCDNNPESAVQVGSYVYFAHKNLGKIFRYNPSNGVQEISDQGMASYFRTLFQEAMASSQDINYNDIRVVGGFDPVQQEYLLTVLYDTTFEDALPDPVVDDPYIEDVDIEEETGEETEDVVDETTLYSDYVFFGEGANFSESIDNPGGFNDIIDFGTIERSSAGSLVDRTFVITNNWYQDVLVKLNDNDSPSASLNPFGLYDTIGGFVFPFRAPWVYSLVDENGLYHINPPGQGGIVVTTLIPAGTSHTFTLRARVDEQIHSQAGQQFPTGLPDGTFHDGTEMLMDQFGTTFRHLTTEERSNATNYGTSGDLMGLTPEYKSRVFAEIKDSNFNLLVSGNAQWSRLINLKVVDDLEGDVVFEGEGGDTETVDTSAYSADLNGDGFVGVSDMLQLLGNFGGIGDNIVGDINNDGSVTVDDLLLLLNQFGGDAPNINDVINVPTLNLDSFANAVISMSNLGQYGTTPIDPDSISTYYELTLLAGNTAVNAILLNQFPEVLNFISSGEDAMNVFMQVYLTDDSGNFIPYGSAPEAGPTPFDLCAWPILQDNNGMVNMASVVSSHAVNGNDAFFAGIPIYAALYSNYDINQFILAYLTDENGDFISVSCNVGGGGVTGGGGGGGYG